ncbi:MAG: DUF1553 domain-containing protein, partial [Gemmataceae bacterium]|nr:DUF1553 domain-containing protein [Gemmataceae bacterium]
MRPRLSRLLLVGGLFALAAPARADTPARVAELTVEPAPVNLTHAHDRQRLLVTGKLADGTWRDLTRSVRYSSADPTIAAVSPRGIVTPRSSGQTTIEVTGPGATAKVPVTVERLDPRPVSFANDIMPLLARSDCNSGGCHGSASGKKGFKISLRGYDPANDFIALTRGTEGRRINPIEPARSLLVLKPTGQVAHEGGKRFGAHSPYADLLTRWIAEGAASDLPTAPKLVGLDVSPRFRSFPTTGLEQQLLATARYSDGTRRDVTGDARYSSSNETTALVSEDGLVTMPAKGEAAVMVRYGHLMTVSTVVVLKHDPAFTWPGPPEHNYIDRHVYDKLRKLQIAPSDLAGDEQFLRRVHYDVLGIPPTPEEVRAFLADKRPDRRARVIDALLERPEHAEFWALKWGDLLKVRFDVLRDKGTWGLHRWIRDAIAVNMPYDRFVRAIVASEGSCAENPPANVWRAFPTADEASEAVVQVFFGVRLLCAKCHDHPFEKWVQTDYYGMSAFFTQVGRKPGKRREDVVIFRTESAPQSRHSTTGATVLPKLLDGATLKLSAQDDARAALADWMTSKDNPFLARAAVNRFWSYLFGRGIIDPVDDIRSSNPPSNSALLDALTRDFIDHNFDVRHILRTILNSRTYQLSARANGTNRNDRLNFARALPRRLSAEQLLDTLSQATGIRANFRSRFGAGSVALPAGGMRAGALPDRQLTAEMLDIFGRPRGESSCSCERHEESSMTQALHLINGKSVARRLADPNGRVAKLVQTPKITDEQIIEELYLAVLCRLPHARPVAELRGEPQQVRTTDRPGR